MSRAADLPVEACERLVRHSEKRVDLRVLVQRERLFPLPIGGQKQGFGVRQQPVVGVLGLRSLDHPPYPRDVVSPYFEGDRPSGEYHHERRELEVLVEVPAGRLVFAERRAAPAELVWDPEVIRIEGERLFEIGNGAFVQADVEKVGAGDEVDEGVVRIELESPFEEPRTR